MKHIKEMHFAGIQVIDGRLTDHLAIQEPDWAFLDWVFRMIQVGEWSKPWMLAFEYGGVGGPFKWRTDPKVIAEQVPLLYERVKRLNV